MPYPKIINQLEQANLIGRGCQTFPTAKKWKLVYDAKEKEKYVICNVSESEPGIFKDEFILNYYPDKILDGIKLAMQSLKAKKGFLYLNPNYYRCYKNKLLALVGEDNIEIFSKPADDYIGGEESALVNLMEGKREEPRLKPPYLTQKGLYGKPTLVNNCETFYQAALISKADYKNEKFFCVHGYAMPKVVLSLPIKTTLHQALEATGHYPDFDFFITLGGDMAGSCLSMNQLQKTTIQSAAGLKVYSLNTDEKQLINEWLSFFKLESCGKCLPCREGTYRLYELFNANDFKNRKKLISDVIFTMQKSTLCSLGYMATNAIVSYYENIRKKRIDKKW